MHSCTTGCWSWKTQRSENPNTRPLEFGQNCFSNLLQFLELFKACSNILGSRAEVLKVCDPVALSWGVQGPDGQRGTDALGHFCQKGLHGSHLPLVDHEPPARVEGVSVPVHHHALHRGQDGHTGGARRHFQASCCRQSAKDALLRQRVEHIQSQIKPPALFFPAYLGSAGIYIPLLTWGTRTHPRTHNLWSTRTLLIYSQGWCWRGEEISKIGRQKGEDQPRLLWWLSVRTLTRCIPLACTLLHWRWRVYPSCYGSMTAMTGFVGQTISGNHNKRDGRMVGGGEREDQLLVSGINEITPRPGVCFLHKIIAACILCSRNTKQVWEAARGRTTAWSRVFKITLVTLQLK